MKIGYVYERDAASPDVQSGRPHAILRAFQNAGMTVDPCFPLPRLVTLRDRVDRWLERKCLANRSPRHLQWTARYVERKLDGNSCDFLFSPSSLPLAYLRTSRPVTFSSDATLRSIAGYYPQYTGIPASRMREYETGERDALHRADLLVYSSEWAAESAVSDYGVPDDRVAVIPSGANLGAENAPDDIRRLILERRHEPLELLFVGTSWERKGGSICLEATKILNERGIPAHLHVVGCQPAIADADADRVHLHGRLRASVASERAALDRLFRRAHLLFVPSRAETFGMVFCEANAYGLPCVSTATGGIPTIIRAGTNGVLLSLEATAADYADAISALWNRDRYVDVALRSYQEFRHRLNWDSWLNAFLARIEPLVKSEEPRSAGQARDLKNARM